VGDSVIDNLEDALVAALPPVTIYRAMIDEPTAASVHDAQRVVVGEMLAHLVAVAWIDKVHGSRARKPGHRRAMT
jgi:hypothetical protein